ncbi:zinc-dependent alcohol dehydrogenase family protein [Rhizobium sp. TRM95796]|uniref:zinc-dependent alcohol dehydrogenase family protein n=1 Tax=Rhizobium sp. TRM95796 TaxID=2979862 RepID=UPI0021E85A42|nr:zinc-dependent alcohol dehydrogenase family protein [Rhizobium sp. TRM95796]MCV3765867.1 zinc-dependent alcohol dehydrogenase family protein [Rhizobium sp. TRM95796]
MKARIALLRSMGAARPYQDSKPLDIVEVDLDEPGAGEVRVKMAAAGLCHSDLSVINGDRPRDMPVALGHEASGVIEAVGPGVARFAPGDHVVLVFVPSCGHCVPCASGRPALCEPGAAAAAKGTLIGGARRLRYKGEPINHHIGVSAFSTHAVVSENSCVKIDKSIPLDRAALLGCAVLTGVGAVLNSGELKMGQSCAVIGLGGVGLAGLLGAIAAGAETVIAVDTAESKRTFAKTLGATHVVDPTSDNAVAEIKDLTGGGVDLAVELAGAAPALKFAYDITRRGGTTVTGGLPNPKAELNIPAVSLTVGEQTLKGSYVGSCVPVRDIPRFAAMMQSGRLPIEKLMTHTISLDDINEGFERLASGEAIRQVVLF